MANSSYVYLINPTFQFMNVSGKPLVDGYVNVYISGTRSKYYAFSDFDGTLHPFNIPLNSLGSAVILVSPAHSYDIYVYNSVGTLQMSRYNITPATGEGTVITDVTTLTSKDGTVDITANSSTNYDLSIATKIAELKQYTDQAKNDAIESANTSIADLDNQKKDKQNELNFNGSATKTVKKITQNANGELNVEFEDINLPQEAHNVEITSEDSSVNITTSVDATTNTKTFDLSVDSITNIASSDGSINVSSADGNVNLTLPSDVVRDSAYTHIDASTANPLMNGTAAVGISDKYAREDHVHPTDTSREDIANKTTVVLGTSDSKYPTDKAVAEFVNSSIDQTYSPTSTKAQSGVAVNEAFKTRETSRSDDSYTYLGMSKNYGGTKELYWKLVSFNTANYWTLQFEIDVSNGRKSNGSYDTEIYETKRLTICGQTTGTVTHANVLRYAAQGIDSSRGYNNNIYYEIDSSNLVTVYIKAINKPNKIQICRLTSVRNFQGISNITWYEPVNDAGTQPTNPVQFKEVFPAIASPSYNIGSNSVPIFVKGGKPVSCNSSNLKAGKDDDGNVIKNTYATKTELNAKGLTIKEISGEQVICFE